MRITTLATVLVTSLGLVTAAHADPAPSVTSTSTVAGPSAGSWSLGVRIPWDGTAYPNHAAIGMGGIGVDVGKVMANGLYLGATGDYEELMDIGGMTGDSDASPMHSRLRGGVEGRYYFHDGSAEASINDGPYFTVPRHDWIGARGGVESMDGRTLGGYADLEIGFDAMINSFGFGMYITGGVSVEPKGLFTSPSGPVTSTNNDGFANYSATSTVSDPTDASGPGDVVSPYVTVGMKLTFG
jgi:hypothetical protein